MSNEQSVAFGPSAGLGYLLKHAFLQMAERADAALASLGIDSRELGILIVINGAEPLSQQQIAQQMGVDRTTMVALLDALEAKEIVLRRPHESDRRRNVVELTAPGRELFGRAVKARGRAEREFLAPLGDEAAQNLRSTLRTLLTHHGSSGG